MAKSRRKKEEIQEENKFRDTPKFHIRPKTPGQKEFFKAMDTGRLIIAHGCAGTGKTILSIAKAIEHLKLEKVDQIILSRPAVDASRRGIGFLPGGLDEKIAPYMLPMLEEIDKALNPNVAEGRMERRRLMECGKIKIEPLEFLRGRNFHRTFMVLDEASNCTFEQLVMFSTRMGEGTKAVISGDFNQTDLTNRDGSKVEGFLDFTDALDVVEYEEDSDIIVCHLGVNDIVRDPIVAKILDRVERFQSES